MDGLEDPDRVESAGIRAGVEQPMEVPVLARGGDPPQERSSGGERDRRLGFVPGEPQDRPVAMAVLGLREQPRLAHPRLADDQQCRGTAFPPRICE